MKMHKCIVCNKYTLKSVCCGSETRGVGPPRFSPKDKYGKYRRLMKKDG